MPADPPVHGQGVTHGAVTPPEQRAGQNEALNSKNVIWSNIFKGKSRARAYQVSFLKFDVEMGCHFIPPPGAYSPLLWK